MHWVPGGQLEDKQEVQFISDMLTQRSSMDQVVEHGVWFRFVASNPPGANYKKMYECIMVSRIGIKSEYYYIILWLRMMTPNKHTTQASFQQLDDTVSLDNQLFPTISKFSVITIDILLLSVKRNKCRNRQ